MRPAGRRQAILAAVLLVSVSFTVATQLDNNLAPFLTQDQHARIVAAADFVAARGWTRPILVAWGSPGLYIWSLQRSYLGDRVGQTYVYYGKLQNLFYLIPPYNDSYYHSVPDVERVAANQNFADLTNGIGADPAAVLDRPVVLVIPDSYNYAMFEGFVRPYGIGDGVFVIPPHAVTPRQLSDWNFSAATDYAWISEGFAPRASWSLSPNVLTDTEAKANYTFAALYQFHTLINANFTLRVHLIDQLATFPSISFLVDGRVVLTHDYTGLGPLWISAAFGPLGPGPHTLEAVSGTPGAPVRVGLDVLQLTPS